MRRWLCYLIPIIFTFAVAAALIPVSTHYKTTLTGICLKTNWSGQIINDLDPVDEVVVEVDLHRKNYLLDNRREADGEINISGLDVAVNDVNTIELNTGLYISPYTKIGREAEFEPGREQEETYEDVFKTRMYRPLPNGSYTDCYIYYISDLQVMMIKDDSACRIYFCSENEMELAELMKYFEDCYQLSPDLL